MPPNRLPIIAIVIPALLLGLILSFGTSFISAQVDVSGLRLQALETRDQAERTDSRCFDGRDGFSFRMQGWPFVTGVVYDKCEGGTDIEIDGFEPHRLGLLANIVVYSVLSVPVLLSIGNRNHDEVS